MAPVFENFRSICNGCGLFKGHYGVCDMCGYVPVPVSAPTSRWNLCFERWFRTRRNATPTSDHVLVESIITWCSACSTGCVCGDTRATWNMILHPAQSSRWEKHAYSTAKLKAFTKFFVRSLFIYYNFNLINQIYKFIIKKKIENNFIIKVY